jgi:two-component system, sensor histidine kinase and response regulator
LSSILVVEDEKEIRSNLVELFESESFEVFSAKDGLEGTEQALKHQPDIILSDIKMPNLNGLDFFNRLKKYPETRSIPFIFLSAKAEMQDFRSGMSLGADDYLVKPINIDEILTAVNTRLQKKDVEREELEDFKNTLIRKIPHEMRTPLVGIIGFSDLLAEDLDTLPKEEVRSMLKMIKDSGQRLQRRIEKFLCLSELLALEKDNRTNEAYQKYTIDERVVGYEMHSLIADYHRIDEVKMNLENCEVFLFEKYFLTLVRELIENALKYSPSNSNIYINGIRTINGYKVQVKNQGPEIPTTVLKRVSSFQQLTVDKDFYEGLGLGLTVIDKITKMVNGYFKVDRIDDEFTLVEIGLPVSNTFAK